MVKGISTPLLNRAEVKILSLDMAGLKWHQNSNPWLDRSNADHEFATMTIGYRTSKSSYQRYHHLIISNKLICPQVLPSASRKQRRIGIKVPNDWPE
ncbi:hypothetical protein TNCV_4734441 [Trichonephila clavipes]|nr:hypothetical protein TNCV_4734441 [Trichonephila clavipes]